MAEAFNHELYLKAETTFNEAIPTSPNWGYLRHTACTLAETKTSHMSDELWGKRDIPDFQYGMKQVGGDITVELHADTSMITLFEAALCGTLSSDVITNAEVRKNLAFLRKQDDITEKFQAFRGCQVSTMNIQAATDAKITATFGIMGVQADAPGATAGPGTPVMGARSTTPPILSTSGDISEGGGASSIITGFNFTVENGMEMRPILGSNLSIQPSIGRFTVTGEITAYFDNITLYNKFRAGSASSSLELEAGSSYIFSFPKIYYTGGQPDVSGQGSVIITMPWQAVVGAGGYTMQIEGS
jgi:hypothetical protein